MTDHLPDLLAAIPAGWHTEYDEDGETLLYYGTARAGRITRCALGWQGGNRLHDTREQAVEAQIEMWEPIIAANEAAGRPPLELPPSPIGRANWGRR